MNRVQLGGAFLLALAMSVSGFAAAGSAQGSRAEAEQLAVSDGMQKLLRAALANKVNDQKTIGDFLQGTEMPKENANPLLQGAVKYAPPIFYADGTCEVRVALTADTLRANLRAIKEQYYKKADGEFASLAFEKLDLKDMEAIGKGKVQPAYGQPPLVAEGIPGWDGVPARKRVEVEHAAYEDALARVRPAVETLPVADNLTLGQLAAQKPAAKAALDSLLAGVRPESKAYLPGGIVRVRFSFSADAVAKALEAANQAAKEGPERLDENQLKTAKERLAGKSVTAVAYARVDGKPVVETDVAAKPVPVDGSVLPALTLEQGK